MRKVFSLLVVTCISTLIVPAAKADSFSVGIYPPVIAIHTATPTDISTPIILEKFSNQPQRLRVSYREFTQRDEESGQIMYLTKSQAFTNFTRLLSVRENTVPQEIITLAAKQKKYLALHMAIPKDMQAINYAFSLIFTAVPPSNALPISNQTASYSVIQAAIASNILFSLGEKQPLEVAIDSFSAKSFYERGPVTFTMRLKNNGRQHTKPQGTIVTKNMFGQTISRLRIPPENILPATARKHAVSWNESFLFGRYTATLQLQTGSTEEAIEKTVTFYALPVKQTLFVALGFFLFLVIVERVQRKMNS